MGHYFLDTQYKGRKQGVTLGALGLTVCPRSLVHICAFRLLRQLLQHSVTSILLYRDRPLDYCQLNKKLY